MEARSAGGREADLAPAPDPVTSGSWIPSNPAPLGAAGFAATTFVLSVINANLVGPKAGAVVLPLAAAYGGLAQLLAGMWEFRTGNTYGAVLFSSFGAFWISVYLLLKAGGFNEAGFSLYLYAWAIFAFIMFLGSLRTNAALALAIFLLVVTFLLLAIGNANLVGSTATTNGTIKLGGWVGIVLAFNAWYLVAAAVLESTFGREVLPVFPLGA
ncbi:MAG: acetate uptake transporter [Solirubrobacteraceae bacterium]|jgi:uncharacterized protein